jgi:dolichol-phosphate mannosyltransferase
MEVNTNKLMISIVVPVYKEENNIAPFLLRMEKVLDNIDMRYEIIFCLDPSPDRTREVIEENIKRNINIKLIQFSRRFRQPAATMAGILNCRGDICVVIDVDLQDPPELIPELVAKWREGYNVVYATRRSRAGETFIKKMVAYTGYKLINKLADISIPTNTGDFRLIDRTIIEELRKLNETHGFLKGLVAFVGFKQAGVLYDRDRRYSGKGNYNRFLGLLKFQLNGIFCFSVRPLQIISGFGLLSAAVGFALAIYFIFQKLFSNPTPGMSATVVCITFFAGIQLFVLGVMCEYIARMYEEVKRRPMYIIAEKIGYEKKETE